MGCTGGLQGAVAPPCCRTRKLVCWTPQVTPAAATKLAMSRSWLPATHCIAARKMSLLCRALYAKYILDLYKQGCPLRHMGNATKADKQSRVGVLWAGAPHLDSSFLVVGRRGTLVNTGSLQHTCRPRDSNKRRFTYVKH